MTTLKDTIIDHVDDKIQAMFDAPAMWGSDESVELQVLQLLEFRSIAVRPEFEKLHPRHILDSYQRFLRKKFPGAPPNPLYCLVEDYNRKSEFIRLLREFCDEQRQEMDQAESPSHDHAGVQR